MARNVEASATNVYWSARHIPSDIHACRPSCSWCGGGETGGPLILAPPTEHISTLKTDRIRVSKNHECNGRNKKPIGKENVALYGCFARNSDTVGQDRKYRAINLLAGRRTCDICDFGQRT